MEGVMLEGRFINLARSTGRRAALEADLARFGAAERYRRFEAVDGAGIEASAGLSPGQRGCLLSHLGLLREYAGAGRDLHIIEDDVVFGPRTVTFMDQTMHHALAGFDMVYTDVSPVLDLKLSLAIARACREVGLEDGTGPRALIHVPLAGLMAMATTSYVVAGRAIGTLAQAVEHELAVAPAPIDLIYHRLISRGQISACCMAPFLTSVRPPDEAGSTIDAVARPMELIAYLIRAPFFVDRDDAAISARLAQLGVDHPERCGPDAVGEVMGHLFSSHFALPYG
jgi:hypothetical protein